MATSPLPSQFTNTKYISYNNLNKSSNAPLFFLNSHTKPLTSFSSSFISSIQFQSQLKRQCVGIARVSTAPVESPPAPEFDFGKEIKRLKELKSRLKSARTLDEKMRVVDSDSRVKLFFNLRNIKYRSKNNKSKLARVLEGSGVSENELFLLKCVVAAGQEHVLGGGEFELVSTKGRSSLKDALYVLVGMIEKWDVNDGVESVGAGEGEMEVLRSLLKVLGEVEQFYDCIGGIIGYQVTVLELLSQSSDEQHFSWSQPMNKSLQRQLVEIHPPSMLDLSGDKEYASRAALWGLEGLPDLGEIYPLGGSADRLGLVDPQTGECLPAAMLPYCGRTLLEGLIRDLQAREFLYFKLYGKQCITPVAIMTSSAKNNHKRITSLCEQLEWFGRGKSSFQFFEQPLVPAISAEDGQWLVTGPLAPVCKPGGHGVIWKLAYDKGVFQWFYSHGRKGATIRQVSNVVAATDLTILALAGIGLRHHKKLGFASCRRNTGATEGVNVLVEKQNQNGQWEYGFSCIEYTEFDKFGITENPVSSASLQAELPANTNILYIDLQSAEQIGSSNDDRSLPGLVVNAKKPVTYIDQFGIRHSVSGGRLECTMQNIADSFTNTFSSRCYNGVEGVEDGLDTFIVYNERRKVTSSAKKKRRQNANSLHQTPDGSLLDIMRNAYDILSHCDIDIPRIETNEHYTDCGPPYLILLHPALGPLWEVTRQKFHGGSICRGSELQVEVAEFLWRDVELNGSLIILANNNMGSTKTHGSGETILQYGDGCAKCRLENVKILNDGIDWNYSNNIYWKHDVKRSEALKVILHGNAELEAVDVTLQGNHTFEVPDGHKMRITSGNSGLDIQVNPINEEIRNCGTWFWEYKIIGTQIQLQLVEM